MQQQRQARCRTRRNSYGNTRYLVTLSNSDVLGMDSDDSGVLGLVGRALQVC